MLSRIIFILLFLRCYHSSCADPQRQWHCRTSSTKEGVLVEIHSWRRTQDIASGGFSPHAVARGALSRSWTQSCLFLSMCNIPSTQLTHAPSRLANGPALCLKGGLGQQNYCRVIPYLWPKFSFFKILVFFSNLILKAIAWAFSVHIGPCCLGSWLPCLTRQPIKTQGFMQTDEIYNRQTFCLPKNHDSPSLSETQRRGSDFNTLAI